MDKGNLLVRMVNVTMVDGCKVFMNYSTEHHIQLPNLLLFFFTQRSNDFEYDRRCTSWIW